MAQIHLEVTTCNRATPAAQLVMYRTDSGRARKDQLLCDGLVPVRKCCYQRRGERLVKGVRTRGGVDGQTW